MGTAVAAPTVAAQQCGLDDDELKCVNAHDRCYGGAGGPCPYCERTTLAPADNGLVDNLREPIWEPAEQRGGELVLVTEIARKDMRAAADTITAQAAEIERLKALLDKAVWQPIETAPKRRLVLLAFDHHPVTVGIFEFGTWLYAFAATEGGDSPTHWMPLPAAPTLTAIRGRTFDGKWVLVPVEPTVAMSAAGMRYIKSVQTDHFQKYAGGIANSIYEKMLTAAQEGR